VTGTRTLQLSDKFKLLCFCGAALMEDVGFVETAMHSFPLLQKLTTRKWKLTTRKRKLCWGRVNVLGRSLRCLGCSWSLTR